MSPMIEIVENVLGHLGSKIVLFKSGDHAIDRV